MVGCCVDQSTYSSGIAIYDSVTNTIFYHDTLKEKDKDSFIRIHNMKVRIFDIFDKYSCDFFTLENIYQNINPRGTITSARLQGALIEECMERNIKFDMPLAKQWRKVCGIVAKGRTNQKLAALQFVKDKFGLDLGNKDDEAEAICIAYSVSKRK